MSTKVWVTIGVLALITTVIRGLGPLAFGSREVPDTLARMIPRLAPAVLAALLIVDTFGGAHHSLVVDDRAGGLIAAAIAIELKAPLPITIVSAAATAALFRALA